MAVVVAVACAFIVAWGDEWKLLRLTPINFLPLCIIPHYKSTKSLSCADNARVIKLTYI